MTARLPRTTPASGAIAFARPKSSTFTVPSARTLTFAGFKSRWIIPCACAASSASAICLAIDNASSSGIGAARDALRQVLAFDQFHHQCTHASDFLQAVDVRDVRMIERRQRLRFAVKPRQPIGVVREGIGQHLEGDIAIELRVAGAKHLAHSPGAECGEDLVGTDVAAGNESHRLCNGLYERVCTDGHLERFIQRDQRLRR